MAAAKPSTKMYGSVSAKKKPAGSKPFIGYGTDIAAGKAIQKKIAKKVTKSVKAAAYKEGYNVTGGNKAAKKGSVYAKAYAKGRNKRLMENTKKFKAPKGFQWGAGTE